MAVPRFLYGTAWKKEATGDLVFKALRAGFRGIDTAAQPRHYNEALVAKGIKEAITKGIVKREDLFVYSDQVHARRRTGSPQHALRPQGAAGRASARVRGLVACEFHIRRLGRQQRVH
ncbi:hypothetical protein NPX13_g10941 [Xylaria arbuscula]|uniref:NADP-dependent oxidoreductase domain-containing protein n=1 Tax=Xylaria arbuscula TaxID=114810 RepID=A0A9W8TGB7_9PEZI|nr:hypothetical protein NPX13_g10941 [Xylaria arbuscula]